MREEKLQSQVAIEFSQKYPEKYGQLFHISNERNNKVQAYKAKSIGIIPGVADFLFVSKKRKVATELKAPGSRHLVSKVRKQIWWGKVWERCGKKFHWRLCRTVDEAISCYLGDYKGMTIKEAEDYINSVKTKTIKF
jgi:hypothetical protein